MPVCREGSEQGWLDLIARQSDVTQQVVVQRTKVVARP
jgi:hypothetical protein